MGYLVRSAFIVGAAALFADCGGSQPQLALTAPAVDKSGPPAGVGSRDLLYVSNGIGGDVSVYRYWKRTFYQSLTGFSAPKGECVDSVGDVFITDSKLAKIFEYEHGAKNPDNILADAHYRPYGCSVDFATGNLAVANYETKSGGPGGIAIYKHALGKPKLYGSIKPVPYPIACGYDNRGNLFIASVETYSGYPYASFAYLPKGTRSFISVRLPYLTSSYPYALVSDVQWDGTYWAVENDGDIFRYSIDQNGNATYQGQIFLSGNGYNVGSSYSIRQFWISDNATQIVSADSNHNGRGQSIVQYWNYPQGGNPIGSIGVYLDQPYGVTVSRGAK